MNNTHTIPLGLEGEWKEGGEGYGDDGYDEEDWWNE